jgi:ADP-ribosylglycohydrolase
MLTVWGRAEQQDFRSRVRGCLLGGAIGDALGAGVESATLGEIRAEHGPDGVADYARVAAYGRRGAVTADTQLTLFTAEGLIRTQVRRDGGHWYPPADVHQAHLRWAATQHDWGPDERRADSGWLAREEWLYARRGPGRACLNGLGDDRMGTLDAPKNPEANDTGTVARSAPFGLLVGWEPPLVFQLAEECAAQTHGHPTALLGAGALAVIIHGLARGQGPDAAVQLALTLLADRPGHEEITAALRTAVDAVRQGIPTAARVDSLAKGGTAAEVLAVAVYSALVAEDVHHGLLLAVNHSGNSASAGAVCGDLLGALHGETALPPAWVAELEGRGTILQLADDFAMEMTQGPTLHGPAGSNEAWLRRYPDV